MATVLIAEDTPEERYLLATELRIAGRQVREACDGKEALELFRVSSPDAVITDIEMPNFDGIGLITAIRKIETHLPIVVVSAGDEQELQRARAAGADLCIAKPFVFC
jgi:CheY-like chemotaxis protein